MQFDTPGVRLPNVPISPTTSLRSHFLSVFAQLSLFFLRASMKLNRTIGKFALQGDTPQQWVRFSRILHHKNTAGKHYEKQQEPDRVSKTDVLWSHPADYVLACMRW